MSGNFRTYKLSELTTKIGSGATPSGGKEAYKESGISLIRSQNVLDFSFSINGLAFIDEKQAKALNNVTVESRDILLNITGDSVARVCQVPDEWLPARVNQHVAIIRANQQVLNPEYLLYYLLTKKSKDNLLMLASAGATRNALTKTMIEDLDITLPPLEEQKAIASILSALDDKIELNLQMNKTLEEMAMALYKHWFVDFGPFQNGNFVESELGMIPEGWEVRGLGEATILSAGGDKPSNHSKDITAENQIPIYSNGISDEGIYGYTTMPKISEESVTISARGTIGFVCLRLHPYFPIVRLISAIPRQNLISNKYLYLYLKNQNIHGTGTTQQQLTVPDFSRSQIVIPAIEVINDFTQITNKLYTKIDANKNENQTLTNLRDTLLPKLISGEVRVKDAEQILAAAL